MSGERLIYFTAGATAILLAYPYLSVLHDSLQERLGRQPVRYDQPYWGPELETSAHEQATVSDDLSLIARNSKFFEWRNSDFRSHLPTITITDYSPDYALGRLILEEGLDETLLPDERSEFINRLNYYEKLEWRFQITVGDDVYALLNEHIEIPYTTEVSEDGKVNYIVDGRRQYMTGTFVSLKKDGQELVDVIQQPPPTSVLNWGLPRG